MIKNIALLLFLAMLSPFALVGFVAGLVACALRGGYKSASELVIWLSQ